VKILKTGFLAKRPVFKFDIGFYMNCRFVVLKILKYGTDSKETVSLFISTALIAYVTYSVACKLGQIRIFAHLKD
jgi:hypothetical protein